MDTFARRDIFSTKGHICKETFLTFHTKVTLRAKCNRACLTRSYNKNLDRKYNIHFKVKTSKFKPWFKLF